MIISTPDKETAVLAIPETCADKIITLSLKCICRTSGHNKMYLAINYLRSCIKDCHICQPTHNEKPPTRQLQTRINFNYRPLLRLSIDLKVMPCSSKGHKFILCIIDEVTNIFDHSTNLPI